MKKIFLLFLFILNLPIISFGQLVAPKPCLSFRENDQTLPLGAWRLCVNNDQLLVEKNTAGAGNYSTLSTIFSLANIFTPAISTEYIFATQTPGGTLTATVPATITLTPVPRGINGTDVAHYLYISGGTGTAEAVLITGGTAIAEATTGTITFTPANNHSGAWTIKTATAGIQEALQSTCSAARSAILIPPDTFNLYSKLSIPCSLSLRGSGIQRTNLVMVSGYTTRAVESITPSGAYIDFGDLSITYTTNGTANEGLYLQEITDGVISNIAIVNAYNGITGSSIGRVYFNNISLFPRNDGYTFSSMSGSSVIAVSVPIITNTFLTMQASTGAGVTVNPTTSGIIIDNLNQALGNTGIQAIGSSGVYNEILVSNSIIDSVQTACLYMNMSGTATAQRWSFSNNFCSTQSGGSDGIDILSSVAGNITSLHLSDNKITLNNTVTNGMHLQGVSGAMISNNIINNNQAGGNAILVDGAVITDIEITNNTLGLGSAYTSTSGMGYGIYISNQAHNRILVHGNLLYGSTALLQDNSTASGVTVKDNPGRNDTATTASSFVATASITNNALTSGRVVFSGTSGLETDDSDLTFLTDTLTATKLGATTSVAIGTSTMRGVLNTVGQIFMSSLTSSAANQTDSLCLSSTNEVIMDTQIGGCIVSSLRYKDWLGPINRDSTDLLLALKPGRYIRKDSKDTREHFGFLAEDVAKIEPRLATFDSAGKPEGVQYQLLTAPIIAAFQQLEARIKALEAHIKILETK